MKISQTYIGALALGVLVSSVSLSLASGGVPKRTMPPGVNGMVTNSNNKPFSRLGRKTRKAERVPAISRSVSGIETHSKNEAAPAENSDSVTYEYDLLNRIISARYASGPTITYTYDAAGN